MTGTVSRDGVYVRGRCEQCGDDDVLVYDAAGTLVCAADYRTWARANPPQQACDECGAIGNVWRDPIPRKNEYKCVRCHTPDSLFQNRWANKARFSTPIRPDKRAKCDASGVTECKGEVKYRSAMRMSLCNKHAGKTGVGPNG